MVWFESRVAWFFFFFKQKTAYEMRISDWSSDVCSSDLCVRVLCEQPQEFGAGITRAADNTDLDHGEPVRTLNLWGGDNRTICRKRKRGSRHITGLVHALVKSVSPVLRHRLVRRPVLSATPVRLSRRGPHLERARSEEHTS